MDNQNFKQFFKDMVDIGKYCLSPVDKCVIVSEDPPQEWTPEVLLPDCKGVTIFGYNQVAMARENTVKLIEALGWTGLCDSMGEARKAIRANSVRVNRRVVNDIEYVLDASLALPCDAIAIEFGKFNYGIIELC